MLRQLRTSVLLLCSFTVLTGLLYPLLVTGISQLAFPHKANGSLIGREGEPIGSELIGQLFRSPRSFWGRISATSPVPYNAAASSGSNFGPLNPTLHDVARARVDELHNADPTNHDLIPVDLVTASGSGLDPHISILAAIYQIPRVARERGISEQNLRTVVDRNIESRDLGVLGEPRVNVLRLNLALDNQELASTGDK